MKVRGIMVQGIQASRPMMEMEIYERGKARAEPAFEPGVPEPPPMVSPCPWTNPLRKTPFSRASCSEPWMFDWLGSRPDKEQRALADWPAFKRLGEDLKDWGANLVELFPRPLH